VTTGFWVLGSAPPLECHSFHSCPRAKLIFTRKTISIFSLGDSLSEQHPLVSEALLTISGNVRNTATLLQVLVVTKMRSVSGFDLADA